MRRDLDDIAGKRFDLTIIGGGIVGAFCACDAARRGLKVLLIEKGDFGAAASESMSHLVHGGIRYLAQGRIDLVREGLAERNRWRRFAPHRVTVQSFLMPLPSGSTFSAWSRRVGVVLFDRLGHGLEGASPARWIEPKEAIDLEPALAETPLSGACIYDECRVDEPERAVLALIADAVGNGAIAANHTSCIGLVRVNGAVDGMQVEDALTREVFVVHANAVLNAAGAAADTVASLLAPTQKRAKLARSKGVHFVTGPIARTAAIALAGGNGHAFIVPWKGFALVGTTDEVTPDVIATPAEDELAKLEKRLRRLLPGLPALERLDAFAGVRALPRSDGATYTAARDIALFHHAEDSAAGLFSIYGGKWTTARMMAERAVDAVLRYIGRTAAPCDTHHRPLACTPDKPFPDFVRAWRNRLPTWPAAEVADWAAAYGKHFERVLSHTPNPNALDVNEREAARFAFAVGHEMAVTSDDLAHRMARWYRIARPGVRKRATTWLATRKSATRAQQ